MNPKAYPRTHNCPKRPLIDARKGIVGRAPKGSPKTKSSVQYKEVLSRFWLGIFCGQILGEVAQRFDPRHEKVGTSPHFDKLRHFQNPAPESAVFLFREVIGVT